MISASLQQRKTRTRRSMLFVHGANAAMVSNSFIYPADALMFDLEDSVALRERHRPPHGLSRAATSAVSRY